MDETELRPGCLQGPPTSLRSFCVPERGTERQGVLEETGGVKTRGAEELVTVPPANHAQGKRSSITHNIRSDAYKTNVRRWPAGMCAAVIR